MKNGVRSCAVKNSLKRHMDESLGWHGLTEHKEDDRLVKKIYSCTAEGTRRKGWPWKRWICVKRTDWAY